MLDDLDLLLEEHEVFKSNMAWERSERRWTILLRLLATFPFAAAFPFLGLFGLFVIPLMWPLACRIVPEPPHRAPFVRYKRWRQNAT